MSSTKLALEQAEAEKRRRINERIARGEAVRMPPVVVGHPCRAAAEKARKIAALRAAGEKREIIFDEQPTEDGPPPVSVIVTGVPRPDRDGDERCADCNCVSAEPRYSGLEYQRQLEQRHAPAPPPMRKPPSPALPLPSEWWPFRVQIRAGNGTTDPGAIIEGRYGVNGDFVFVEDDQGQPVAMQRLGPNENAAGLAQKLLREKWRNRSPNAPAGFYDGPINRSTRTYH